ncbi:MAG: DUF2752 domain-containing protein [Muribaculaceae bacterium]|nr:DUF2752 domain-containing protein [Muribaculaceae bacterium]
MNNPRQTPPPLYSKTKIAAIVAAVFVLSFLCVFYYYADPASAWMPRCFFRYLTGYDCPGCGFQRALHAALHGNIAAAWGYNPFVFFALPAAVFYIVVEAGRSRWPRLHVRANHPLVIGAILLAVITFWIGRNL